MQLEEWRGEFVAVGVNVAGMTYDSREALASFHAEENLGYPLLQDENAKHVNAFGVRDEDYAEGHSAYGIPRPGILLIDADGVILAKYALPGYRRRPPFDAMLEDVNSVLSRN